MDFFHEPSGSTMKRPCRADHDLTYGADGHLPIQAILADANECKLYATARFQAFQCDRVV